MSEKKIVETIYGKAHKFEIVRRSEFLGYSFAIYRDGEYFKGSYSDLSAAVAAAKKEK